MPNVYRAPEVMLRSSWGYKVDIWNIAMVVSGNILFDQSRKSLITRSIQAWDIVSPRTLINGKNADGIPDDRVHMAELVALLGPPPPEFHKQRHLGSVYWDEESNWKDAAPIPDITLEVLAENIRGKDKEGFLRWLRMALQWNPEDRPTALELLYDDWMMEGLGK